MTKPTRPRLVLVMADTSDRPDRLRRALSGPGWDLLQAEAAELDADVELVSAEPRDASRPVSEGDFDEFLGALLAEVDRPTVLLRADLAPHARGAVIAEAMSSLEGPWGDAVLGLTSAGPWWLLGLHRPMPEAVIGVPQQGPEAGERQLDRLHALGLAVGLVERLVGTETLDDARLAVDGLADDGPGAGLVRALGEG